MSRRHLATWGVAVLALSLTGCGGGTDGTGVGPSAGAAVTSSGAMTRGSVILNGTRFDDATAIITDDRGRGAARLETGMVVKLRGRSDDGVNGVADRIDIENEVRGSIQSIDAAASPQRFIVTGLTVLVDDQTAYANVAGFAALAIGLRVEVHGLRDAGGVLRATRVEAVGAQDGLDELRGAIGNLDTVADQFTLNGNVPVHYGGASFSPAGASEASLTAGVIVEVRGSFAGGVFTASRVEIEDLEDEPFRGLVGEKQEVEGFVSGFTAHPGSLQVNGRTVQTTASTRFEGGTAADLANGVKIEAEGRIDAQGVLVATKIAFKQTRVILHGRATAVDAAARTLVVLGQSVRADDLTRIDARSSAGNSTQLADIVANVDCVEVRGTLVAGSLVAEEIREPSGCSRDLVQARVLVEDEANARLGFFGNLVALLPANAQFRNLADAPITRAEFFAAVNAAGAGRAGTLVKLRGAFAGGILTVEEAELED